MRARPLILLTNDDGVHAPGIAAMAAALQEWADVVVSGPRDERSGASHSVTLRQAIGVTTVDEAPGLWRYAVAGTPVDCVTVGVGVLCPRRPDAVVAGVNLGRNVASDVNYSGTVAGAVEGSLLDLPAVAVSLDVLREPATPEFFAAAAAVGSRVVCGLLAHPLPHRVFLNVNVPSLRSGEAPRVRATRQSREAYRGGPTPVRGRGRRRYLLSGVLNREDRGPDTDLGTLEAGLVSVCMLQAHRGFPAGSEGDLSWLPQLFPEPLSSHGSDKAGATSVCRL